MLINSCLGSAYVSRNGKGMSGKGISGRRIGRSGCPDDPDGGFQGGYADALPPSASLPNYTYLTISERSLGGLQMPGGMCMRRWEVNCFGTDAGSAIALANAITDCLIGYHGTLADIDATDVDSIFQSDVMDFEQDPTARNYRRMVEFDVNYYPRPNEL